MEGADSRGEKAGTRGPMQGCRARAGLGPPWVGHRSPEQSPLLFIAQAAVPWLCCFLARGLVHVSQGLRVGLLG